MTLHGYLICGGFLYLGRAFLVRAGRREPSTIDPDLPVAARRPAEAPEIDYWPSYDGLEPGARACYLHWLSRGRTTAIPIGYVFIYFYGLEHRLLAEKLDESSDSVIEERAELQAEVRRLQARYGPESCSFEKYALGLLDAISALEARAGRAEPPHLPPAVLSDYAVRLAIGQQAKAGRALSAEWALAWFVTGRAFRRPSALARDPAGFQSTFLAEFRAAWPGGMPMNEAGPQLKFTYRAASAALYGPVALDVKGIPDPEAVRIYCMAVEMAAEAAADVARRNALRATRALRSQPEADDSRERLLSPDADPLFESLRRAIGNGIQKMSFHTLAERLRPLNQSQVPGVASVAGALDARGFGIDLPEGTGQPPRNATCAIWMRPDPGPRDYDREAQVLVFVDTLYDIAFTELSAPAASEAVNVRLGHFPDLTYNLLAVVDARLLCQRRPSKALLQRLDQLPAELKLLLIEEIKALVAQWPHADSLTLRLSQQYRSRLLGEPPSTAPAARTTSTAYVPRPTGLRPPAPVPAPAPAKALDMDAVQRIVEETKLTDALLSAVFTEADDATPVPPSDPASIPSAAGTFGSRLDTKHQALLQQLLSIPEPSRAFALSAAQSLGLFLDAAIERINDAAFDHFGEPLIEGEDPLLINPLPLENA